jgi:putative hydrolase of the HAD superfamily
MLRFALFDLDDTLYDSRNGLWEELRQRITHYMIERVHIDPAKVPELRKFYLENYGTALNGLRHHYEIDSDDFLAYVHDVPLDNYLQPNPALEAMLKRLPLRKVIFTNADVPHANRVLNKLGVAEHFERLIDIRAMEFNNKPDPRAYQVALQLLGAQAEECVFADDAMRNLLPAKKIGMTTILVNPHETPGADYWVRGILEVEAIVRQLIK